MRLDTITSASHEADGSVLVTGTHGKREVMVNIPESMVFDLARRLIVTT